MSRKPASAASVFIVYVVTMLFCFVIFGSAAVVLLDKFVTQPKLELEADRNQSVTEAVTPEADYSDFRRTFLFVNAQGEELGGIVLIRVMPDTREIKLVPVSPYTLATVGDAKGTIKYLYEAGGMTYLYKAVEDAFGFSPEKYIKINNQGFNRLTEYLGGTSSYVFPKDLNYKDEETGILTSFSQGPANRTLWGDDIRRIVNYPLYEKAGRDQISVLGEISTSLINSALYINYSNVNSNLQNIFNTIFNNSDTDITSKDFKNAREAYEYLTDEPKQSASYRLPAGTWNEDYTKFTVDEEFKTNIREYFEISAQ